MWISEITASNGSRFQLFERGDAMLHFDDPKTRMLQKFAQHVTARGIRVGDQHPQPIPFRITDR